ncbi:hypothetical protein HPB52_006045 [Rhipicephalus sanguineus]|uniref:Uncharacterized protein n=1 Tax=Rhipicephalus sanguineus TaxID=34632 RepID=A0A9D4Q570_RHISA|nr:hypothetical protein HPB52_006045 [Rhipicephalus sanguineus]
MKSIEEAGFQVVRLVADNHFQHKYVHHIREWSNDASCAVRHPVDNNRKLFLAFDHFHILKNLRKQLLYANRVLCNNGPPQLGIRACTLGLIAGFLVKAAEDCISYD